MPRRTRVIPYRAGSRGATALSRALGGLCLRLNGSRFQPRPTDLLINWGNTNCPYPLALNAGNINVVSNKLNFFRRMDDTGLMDIVPAYWTNREEIPDEAFPVVCRTVLAGHSGDGIVIANNRAELVPASLYVKYVKKNQEWRIHVGQRGGESIIIAVQRKARRLDVPDDAVNWQVRNHHNGFIYARNDGAVPGDSIIEAAKRSLVASGLDFGAVDVIYNEHQERAYVLEINTAPGLEGSTLDDYVRFFTNL